MRCLRRCEQTLPAASGDDGHGPLLDVGQPAEVPGGVVPHLVPRLGHRGPGRGRLVEESVQETGTEAGEASEPVGAGSDLTALLHAHPKIMSDLQQFLADNSAQDPVETHLVWAKMLAAVRRQQRGDLWQLVSKETSRLAFSGKPLAPWGSPALRAARPLLACSPNGTLGAQAQPSCINVGNRWSFCLLALRGLRRRPLPSMCEPTSHGDCTVQALWAPGRPVLPCFLESFCVRVLGRTSPFPPPASSSRPRPSSCSRTSSRPILPECK